VIGCGDQTWDVSVSGSEFQSDALDVLYKTKEGIKENLTNRGVSTS